MPNGLRQKTNYSITGGLFISDTRQLSRTHFYAEFCKMTPTRVLRFIAFLLLHCSLSETLSEPTMSPADPWNQLKKCDSCLWNTLLSGV